MSPTFIMALGSALLYGAADFSGGLATRRTSAIPVVLINHTSGMILLALLMPFLPPASPSRVDLLWGVAAGLTGSIGVALLYRALAIGTMTVVAPITAVCAVAIPVIASILLGERPVPIALAGILLGILSIVLVSHQRVSATTGQRSRAGVGTALISGVAIGIFFLIFAQTDSNAGMWPLLVARAVSFALFGAIAITGRRSLRMPGRVLAMAIASGVLDMLANALYLLAARQGPLSLVVTLSSLYPASTALLARVVLRERLSLWQVIGVGCALAAVVLIVSG